MKTIFKQTLIFTALFAVSGTAAFFACYKGNNGEEIIDTPEIPLTPQEKIVDSMTNMKGFDLSANAKIITGDNQTVDLAISNGQCSLEDLDHVQVKGDIKVNYGDLVVEGSLTYINDTIFFSYAGNYFKMATDSVLNFVDMLPTYGVNISVPDDVKNLNLEALQEQLNAMVEMPTPDGGYYFVLEINKDIKVYLKSDANYNFTGIRCDDFYYQGSHFSFDANVVQKDVSALSIINPLTTDVANKYQNFEPCFDLFNAAYNLFQKRTNSLLLDVDIDKSETTGETIDFLNVNGTMSYNLDNSHYGFNAAIVENSRSHNFNLSYADKNAFLDYNDLKISITTDTVSSLLEYVIYKIGDEKITSLFNNLTSSMKDPASLEKLSQIGNLSSLLKTITVTDNQVICTIDPSVFGLEASEIIIATNFSKTVLESLSIKDIEIKGYKGNITISSSDYVEPNIDKSQYVAIDPAFTLFDTFESLSKQNQFRLEFSGLVDNDDVSVKDITVGGGLQFDVKNQFGYGEMNIVDKNEYSHNLKVDVRNPQEVIFAYNENLRGKLSVQTLKDVTQLGKEIYQEKDAHFMELFGDLLSSVGTTPLGQALNGDYGVLLSSKILSNLSVTTTAIDFKLNGGIIGLDEVNMDVHIDYDAGYGDNPASLNGLKVSNLSYKGNTYSFSVNLKSFDSAQESSRLDPSKEYLDFSDIKVLLQLGINTSKFNYYHFTAVAKVKITFFSKDIPLDIKIRNNKGKVQIAIDIGEIPTIILVNKNSDYSSTSNRYAHIYYEDNMFYVNRTEKVRTGGFFIPQYGQYNLDLVCDQTYFFDNIMDIMCKDVLGFQDLIMDQIVSSTNEGPTKENPIHYENVLNDFSYNKDENYFNFDINIQELSKNEDLKTFTIKVYEDTATNQLKGLSIYFKVSVGISIELTLDLELADASVELNDSNTLTALNNYVSAHKNDTKNEVHTSVTDL